MQDLLEHHYDERGEMVAEATETGQWQVDWPPIFARAAKMEFPDECRRIYHLSTVDPSASWLSGWYKESPAMAELSWQVRDLEPDREALASQLRAAVKKYLNDSPERQPAVSRGAKLLFDRDLEEWRSDTRFSSNLSALLSHPAYLRIIAMGHAVLPLILEDMQNGGGHWFVALRAITREDPVPPEHRSHPRLMCEDWLRWAAAKGFINDRMGARSTLSGEGRRGVPPPQG
ncbi:MAG: hypothetical protein ACP5O1_12475 [Phycisphaerae bacterium]